MSNDLVLRACLKQPVERTPVWIMRQAGRCLPEYRAVRDKVDFLTLCRTPELAAKVTLQPVDRFGVDAAILFSDILVPAEPLGFDVKFEPGPVIDRPIRSAADVARMRDEDPEESVAYVYQAIRILRRQLQGRVPLIGFGAAPLTLAAYLVEGRGSRNFEHLKGLLYGEPKTAHDLLEKITETTVKYLSAQVRAGAQAIQLFDTWAGLLGPSDYREFSLRYVRQIMERLRGEGVPLIYFALNSAHLLDEIRDCDADVVSLDWRVGLAHAAERLGPRFALQGNLDPCALFSPPDVLRRRIDAVLEQAASLPGHIFNLGHGVLPQTSVDQIDLLVRHVRDASNSSKS